MLPLCALAVVWREDEIEAMVRNDARGDLLYERIDRLTVREQPGVIDRTEPMKQRRMLRFWPGVSFIASIPFTTRFRMTC
jgi:hypothetical protein